MNYKKEWNKCRYSQGTYKLNTSINKQYMKIKKLFLLAFFSLSLSSFVVTEGNNDIPSIEKQHMTIEYETSTNKVLQKDNSGKVNQSLRIIKGSSMEMVNCRRGYDLAGREISTRHFAFRVTKPYNPFRRHKHEQSELWFIVKGSAKVFLDGKEYPVEENDLIILDPWIEHGLSTSGEVTWICVG